MSEYDDGYNAGRNAPNIRESYQNGKAIGNMAVGGVALAFRLVVETLVASPFLLFGWMATMSWSFLGPGFGTTRFVGIVAVAYLFYALLYVLKGVAIASRLRGGRRWLVPFILCLVVACLVPGWLLHLLIVHFVPTVNPFLAWGISALFMLFVYNRYRFTEDYAPNLGLWAYRRGYQWAIK